MSSAAQPKRRLQRTVRRLLDGRLTGALLALLLSFAGGTVPVARASAVDGASCTYSQSSDNRPQLNVVEQILATLEPGPQPSELGERIIPADPAAIILPEGAFQLAIAESGYHAVDDPTRMRAVALTAAANDPATLGLFGEFRATEEPQPFSGTVFIVVRDSELPADGGLIPSTDYYVAAVELSGTTPWLGRAAGFARHPGLAVSTGRCCGPTTICVPDDQGPQPPCDPRIELLCTSPSVGVTNIKPAILDAREQSGLPLVQLHLYGPRSAGVDPGRPILIRNGPQVFQACTNVIDKFCTQAKPACQFGDIGHTPAEGGGADTGSGSTSCPGIAGGAGSGFVVPQNIPEWCLYAYTDDPACGGWTFSFPVSEHQAGQLPPQCLRVQPVPGSDICDPPTPAKELAKETELRIKAGLVGRAGTQCEPTRYDGHKLCVECASATGPCRQYVDAPAVDPAIADEAPSDDEEEIPCPIPDDEAHCRSNWEQSDFEPAEVIGKKPAQPAPTTTTVTEEEQPPPPKPNGPRKPGGGGDAGAGASKVDLTNLVRPPERVSGEEPPATQPERKSEISTGKVGDPIFLGDGSFDIRHVDLSFESPVRPLEFQRSYNSGRSTRGTLGSNWQHNWDVRIQPLLVDTMPSWASVYCAASEKTPTCLLLHNGDGTAQLFFLDMKTRLFLPQAGSVDTIAPTNNDGWALRRADGHMLFFNEQGYLVNDRDRFGNGFRIEYEPTPLFEMYEHYCGPQALAARNETKYSRRCAVLAYLMEDARKPDAHAEAWEVTLEDYPFPSGPSGNLFYARAYFFFLLSLGSDVQSQGLGYDIESVFGGRQFRPTRVVDDFGRSLTFTYYRAADLDFASVPHAELLEEVRGPAGTAVRFEYARPVSHAKELNELFLTRVGRRDLPVAADLKPAPNRAMEYAYQWPGGPAPSFDHGRYAQTVYDKFSQYYGTFIGCWRLAVLCPGQYGKPEIDPRDPNALAWQQRNAYISGVADNIIQVFSNGVTESETRYAVDPWSPEFDRVTAQRYGSSRTAQDPALLVPDRTTDNWQTTLPKATLAYQTAGPAAAASERFADLTDAFLPQEIRDRYPLETSPSLTPPEPIKAVVAVPEETRLKACNYSLMDSLRAGLPGYRPTWPYYDVQQNEAHPNFTRPLYRSRLSCDQLAVAQVSNPTHNDLVSDLQPITSTADPTDHIATRIVGQRRVVAANANRICGWVHLVDRDGNTHYYGLNYRGQALVDAVKERETGRYIFSETLYNADGMVVQERRPTRGPQPWSPTAGSTTYAYEEIDPNGNGGWNDWLPVFWSRRTNLLRVEEHSAGNGVIDAAESPTGGFTTSIGRYRSFEYEPLFNQLRSIQVGRIEEQQAPTGTAAAYIPQERVDYVFDYQELSLKSTEPLAPSLEPVLDHLKPWGFAWLETEDAQGELAYDYDTIGSWQLPLMFYDDTDLNGDGQLGFGYGAKDHERARGVPVVAVRRPATGATASERHIFVWAPHGMPAILSEEDGAITVLEYYSIGSPGSAPEVVYGGSRGPTDQEVSVGFRGLLGRVRTSRFASAYPADYGPPEPSCAALAGPYQWLLPADCSEDPESELLALGLPQQTVDAILSSTEGNSGGRWLTSAFSYSEIGHTRHIWTDTGGTHLVRDTDGREREITDPLGNASIHTYTDQGYPERTVWRDTRGQLLGDSYRQFDEDGRVLYVCSALSAGGCEPLGDFNPADGVVQRFEYWPEGGLRMSLDPEGLRTDFIYDERQLLVRKRSEHSIASLALRYGNRQESYSYNLDGDLTSVRYGALTAPFLGATSLSENYEYDGLRRLKTYRDTRRFGWQFAYFGRDLLTRYKRDEVPYGSPSAAVPTWETELSYDGLGRLQQRVDNGVLTARYARTAAGTVYASSSTGLGRTYTISDAFGRPIWSRDPNANQVLYTWRPIPHVSTSAFIRTDGKGQRHTVASIVELDAVGLPLNEIRHGAGKEQRWVWERDGAGFILRAINPENLATRYDDRNLLGWPKYIAEQRTEGTNPAFDIAELGYNKRGQVERIVDPAGQVTEFLYDAFGALRSIGVPGQPRVLRSFTYDILGRLDEEQIGTAQIKYRYDLRGDPVGESVRDLGVLWPLAERSFDDLGRVREAKDFNYALINFLPVNARTVTQSLDYDTLGRIRRDGLQVGLAAPHDVFSAWSVIAPDVWRRELSYRIGSGQAIWHESFDESGRLARKERLRSGGPSLQTSFQWLGDLYTGRVQDQEGRPSPFRERRGIDPFGRTVSWQYTAIDLDQSGDALNTAEGIAYCSGRWNASACARPLLAIDALRDVMGRMASLKWGFGHPVFSGGGSVPSNHPRPWRGYAYNTMGQLDYLWEHAGANGEISTAGLATHTVTAGDLQRLGATSEQWKYLREPAVGGTEEIRNATTGSRRWALRTPRGIGHQVQQVEIDGTARSLTHDAAGRVQTDGAYAYLYDPRGRLSAIVVNGAMVEAYLYDASGRLTAVVDGTQRQLTYSFAYDGDQIVTAHDAQDRPLWEAAWGPGTDQLIGWEDHAGRTGHSIPLIDHRNSVVGAWNASSGRVAQTAEYNPEGRLLLRDAAGGVVCQELAAGRICANPSGMPFGFASAWRSQVSGLIYMRNRWYSPELGQFISYDPIGFADSYNLYAFAGFDPINKGDPLGLRAKDLGTSGVPPGWGWWAEVVRSNNPIYDVLGLDAKTRAEWQSFGLFDPHGPLFLVWGGTEALGQVPDLARKAGVDPINIESTGFLLNVVTPVLAAEARLAGVVPGALAWLEARASTLLTEFTPLFRGPKFHELWDPILAARLRAQRALADELVALAGKPRSRQPAVLIGASNWKTGETVVRPSSPNKPKGCCAEVDAWETLGSPPPEDVVFTMPVHPRLGRVKAPCPNCEAKFSASDFPPGTPRIWGDVPSVGAPVPTGPGPLLTLPMAGTLASGLKREGWTSSAPPKGERRGFP